MPAIASRKCSSCEQPVMLHLLSKIILRYKYPNEWEAGTLKTVDALCTRCQWESNDEIIEALLAVDQAPPEMFTDSRAIEKILKIVIFKIGFNALFGYVSPHPVITELLAKTIYRWRDSVRLESVLFDLSIGMEYRGWGWQVGKALGRLVFEFYIKEMVEAVEAGLIEEGELDNLDKLAYELESAKDLFELGRMIDKLDSIRIASTGSGRKPIRFNVINSGPVQFVFFYM
ncbi:hypothetical protein F4781DRAFT_194420 [Annulohypoxylon bovei var. microspora]|nr:hypothetical protein F4781DRAFT_194420 [Annulohypoxylon bovei var. microspora]